ncbi:hypothetical protein UC317_2331 [Lactococcus lactis subsp. lactis]|nr:hypothetical protein UC317_2331 [Lactococcus lactis subsp. lactis]
MANFILQFAVIILLWIFDKISYHPFLVKNDKKERKPQNNLLTLGDMS